MAKRILKDKKGDHMVVKGYSSFLTRIRTITKIETLNRSPRLGKKITKERVCFLMS